VEYGWGLGGVGTYVLFMVQDQNENGVDVLAME
jgi:hypothetical protein